MFDITRALLKNHPTWPGDTPYALEQTSAMAEGASVNVMALSTSTHLGTHLDAPYHFRDDGSRLGAIDLQDLIGPAQVLDVLGADPVSAAILDELGTDLPPRILLHTGQPDRWDAFPESFAALSVELIEGLSERGVRLVGTDAPSVDSFTSRELPVHAACWQYGINILEGLALARTAPGRYRLICLPLHLPDADASPVRAILETL